MQIDWFSFTPVPSLLGGMILGVAAALFVLLHGRILGVSGIISGLLHPKAGDSAWRLSLVLGLVSAPFLAALFLKKPLCSVDELKAFLFWFTLLFTFLFD